MPILFGVDRGGVASDLPRPSARVPPAFRNAMSVGLVLAIAAQVSGVTIGPSVTIGTIGASSLPEVSGIVDSRANANTFWVHNDSGDSARFYAINHQGALLGTFPLAGAPFGDWEDIAMSPNPLGGNYLYLGDIGDNDSIRSFITVYRTAEPLSTTGVTIPASGYSPAKLQYPSGPRNAESLFVDPLTNDVYIITKDTIASIFSAPASIFDNPGQTTTLTALGSLGSPLNKATAADISPDGYHILVRSKSVGYLFERVAGQSIAEALHGTAISFTLGAESQGEAIGWAANGTGFYTTSESNGLPSAPIHSYTFAAPAGDYTNNGVFDAADYTIWRDTLGSTFDMRADGDHNGVVNADDYRLWQAGFGGTGGSGAASASPNSLGVPEPTSISLLWLGAATLVTMVGRRCAKPSFQF
jgi:hypothetical protein